MSAWCMVYEYMVHGVYECMVHSVRVHGAWCTSAWCMMCISAWATLPKREGFQRYTSSGGNGW
jgi:hypothetical protein